MQKIFGVSLVGYLLFFACFYKIIEPFGEAIRKIGIGLQSLIVIGVLFAINKIMKRFASVFVPLKNIVISDMLLVYAFVLMLVAFVLVNELPRNLFELAF